MIWRFADNENTKRGSRQLEIRLEQKLAHLATKAELEAWGGALLARIESGEQRMLTELARHAKAIQDAVDG